MLVLGAQLAFGMWMNSRGFIWNDALSRAASALFALHSADPRLVAIGFVWMPLPGLVELLWVAFYPLWPGVVSSGFASTFTTALAGGATAALLLYTARRLGLSERLGWAFALLVAANPMLFLYAGNGMSEGLAAPFLTGAVAFLVLFWHTARRRYIAASALTLALGFASLYEAVPYGAAVFAALVLGMFWGAGSEGSASGRGNWRSAAGLSTLFLIPSLAVAALWVGANAAVMDDPLFFATSQYSNAAITAAAETEAAQSAAGELLATFAFVAERTTPFLIPGAFLLLVRALDGRFRRANTLSLVLLLLSVPFGLIAPLLYLGASFGWLRFFMYPLFVAAGWGLYEVAVSRRRRRRLAAGLVLAGWVAAAPIILWAMASPSLGREEHWEVRAFLTGRDAEQVGFDAATGSIERDTPVTRYLDKLPDNSRVVLGASGWSVAVQASPNRLEHLVLPHDSRYGAAISNPRTYGVSYFLVPNPSKAPNDPIVRHRPSLWSGEEPGFELVESFPKTPQEWRLYEVVE